MTSDPEKCLVFAGMRNEGAFITEWVSWYRMLGFEVLVGINDCTDHSPELLQRLAEEGWLTLFRHQPGPGVAPKISAHRAMRRQAAVAACDWLLICDVDEFLVLHEGDGTIGSYLDRIGREHLGVAFYWQCFGNSGHKTWEDGLVHRQFTRVGPRIRPQNAWIKTMTHNPLRFRRFSDHSPWDYDGTWGPLPDNIVDADGRAMERFLTHDHPIRFTDPSEITHRGAQMNHYVIRSDESFALKRGTPSASALKDRYTQQFYTLRNRNDAADLSALGYAEPFDRVHAAAMALPGVRRLHHLCCADYVVRLCAVTGADPKGDARWHFHMQQAEIA
jgi:hypothetical protein